MKLLIITAILLGLSLAQADPISDYNLTNPGLSMSLDLSIISQAKDVYLSSVLKQINGLSLPNILLSAGDGHVNANKVYIKQRAQDVILVSDDITDAYIV